MQLVDSHLPPQISVMQYRESLEEQDLRNINEIERKVANPLKQHVYCLFRILHRH
jgi:cell fate (sporulation/competence/biofilm development) regulator YlbF (YheA/YmcA/DUF963 family)